MIQNPAAYTLPRLTARHEHLVKRWRVLGGRFGPNQKDELWRIEHYLNEHGPKPKRPARRLSTSN